MRPLLALATGAVALVTGLAACWIQCENHARAGRLDALARECAWLERCSAEHRQRIATASFETERAFHAVPRAVDPVADADVPSEPVPGSTDA